MRSFDDPRPHARALSALLTLLGDAGRRVVVQGTTPALVGPDLHLPATVPDSTWCHAAAAHAAAHGRYSRLNLPRARFTPITQALMGALEDARVELLAMADLPGLARWWLPRHRANPGMGDTFEALLERLGRALVDPAYGDDHPWVRKGVDLFFADPDRRVPALVTGDGEALARLASRLGHDIGQMRLPFNDRVFTVAPSYRDDHRWMWQPTSAVTEERTTTAPPSPGTAEAPPEGRAVDEVQRFPEWDHRINRLRPDWCTVREQWPARTSPAPPVEPRLRRDLERHCRRRTACERRRLPRQRDGEELDLPAVVDRWAAPRGTPQDEDRLHVAREPARGPAHLVIVLDASASTGTRDPSGGTPPLLTDITTCGLALAAAWRAAGGTCALQAFRSRGRHAVDVEVLADFTEPLSAPSLRAEGSTRLGAALRHGTRRLAGRHGTRWLVVVTDGQPHDIDLHDPRYLVEDAREAVRTARRLGIRTSGLAIGPGIAAEAVRRGLGHIFGPGQWTPLRQTADLARALGRLG